MKAGALYIVGLGVCGRLHVTPEVQQVLGSVRRAYVLMDDPDLLHFVGRFTDVVDAADFYPAEGVRADVYARISEAVIAHAVEGHRTAFVVQGHPLFLVSASERMLATAEQSGVRATVLPAVSSFDTIMADLGEDLGYAAQLFDATTMIRTKIVVNPGVPCLVFQIANTLRDEIQRGDLPSKILAPLQQYLLGFYEASRVCKLVVSSTSPLRRAEILKVTLGELAAAEVELWKRPTLYIPA